jgi:hypothetical protein
MSDRSFLLQARKFRSVKDFLPVLEQIAKSGWPLEPLWKMSKVRRIRLWGENCVGNTVVERKMALARIIHEGS